MVCFPYRQAKVYFVGDLFPDCSISVNVTLINRHTDMQSSIYVGVSYILCLITQNKV